MKVTTGKQSHTGNNETNGDVSDVVEDIFKVLKEKTTVTKNSIYSKTVTKNEGKLKTFPDKQKAREFITSRHAQHKILKEVLHTRK